MTRSYFLDYVDDWSELIELCREYDCGICEDVIHDEDLDDYVDADVSDCDYFGWRTVRDYLNNIPTGYDYYRRDGSFDYVGLDDSSFEDYKSAVFDWMDDNDLWDYEEGEEDVDIEESEEAEEPEEPPVEEEDFSATDLISMCSSELLTIQQAAMRQKKEIEDVLDSLLLAV